MTRKHFQAIADAMRNCRPDHSMLDREYKQWVQSCHELASVCANANVKFNRIKFLEACGVV